MHTVTCGLFAEFPLGAASSLSRHALFDKAVAFRESLCYIALSKGCPRDVAEDLAQETLLDAWRSWEQLSDQSKLTSWLAAITRMKVAGYFRKKKRVRDLEGIRLSSVENFSESQDDAFLRRTDDEDELAILLRKALATLSPQETIVVLMKFNDCTLSQIATTLDTSVYRVRKTCDNAVRKMRNDIV